MSGNRRIARRGRIIDWKNPDYSVIIQKRLETLEKIKKGVVPLGNLKEFYKTHPVEFITDWGMTYDPRNADIGLPTTIPFILFPKQEELVMWLYDRWRGREDGLIEKTREEGVTWICCAFAVWAFIFIPGVSIGFGSRTEDMVDIKGDPGCIFWKVKEFIKLLPKEFKPKGYNEKINAKYMLIKNPENGSSIVGGGGENMFRGHRLSIIFKDESAFYIQPEVIEHALSAVSNCKIDISTPNLSIQGMKQPYHKKRVERKIPIFRIHWTDDPRKDENWYKIQKSKLDEMTVAQEIDIAMELPLSKSILKKPYWQIWPIDKPFPKCNHVFTSWDTAFSDKDLKNNAFSAFTKWGVFEREGRNNLFLIDAWYGQVDFDDLVDRAEKESKEPISFQLIEKKASGISLLQVLRRRKIKIRPYLPDRDKIARAYAVQDMLATGQVWIPERKWAKNVRDIVSRFPIGEPPCADLTDTVTQALDYVRRGRHLIHPHEDEEKPIPKIITNDIIQLDHAY